MKRSPNWYASMCGENYWAERGPQIDRVDEHAIGYDTDERDYYARVEPQIAFRDILIQTGREWSASKESAWAT